MKSTKNYTQKTKKLTIIAIFCAMAFVVSVILPIKVMFLTLDFKDSISTICGLFFGPAAGIFCAAVVPFIEFTVSDTGVYGLIMNLLSSVTFVGISTLIYKYKKTIWGAVIGLVSGSFAMVAVMLLANLFITPHFMNATTDAVIELIPKLILPFNLVKTVLNAGVAMLIYKPISKVLKRMGVSKSFGTETVADGEKQATETVSNSKNRSLLVTLISVAVITVALVILFVVLGGKIG